MNEKGSMDKVPRHHIYASGKCQELQLVCQEQYRLLITIDRCRKCQFSSLIILSYTYFSLEKLQKDRLEYVSPHVCV